MMSRGIELLEDGTAKSVRVWTVPFVKKSTVVSVKLPGFKFDETDSFQKLITHRGFIACYYFNADDSSLQNFREITAYTEKGLVPIAVIKDPFGRRVVDIEKNPGFNRTADEMWLTAPWKLWVAPNFLQNASRERLLSFPDAEEIKELANGIIYVRLFDDPTQIYESRNLKRQKGFRDWVNW